MQIKELTYLLQHPETVTSEQTQNLSEAIKRFPYFQALRALYLKGLKNKDSYKYNNALKVTASHTADRSILFDYITSEEFNQNEISNQIKQNYEHLKTIEVESIDDISVNKSVDIDDKLKEHIKATEGVLDPNLFEAKLETHQENYSEQNSDPEIRPSIISVDVENITPEKKLNIGKPLEFDKNESHSFMEWLKITSFKPIDRSNEVSTITDENEDNRKTLKAPLEKKLNLIDKFISENPKINPITGGTPQPKLISNEETVSESLMTETLARIYLEQKNYDKAIQSYKILSLKYPEKSSFFADRIKAVEELREQNNS